MTDLRWMNGKYEEETDEDLNILEDEEVTYTELEDVQSCSYYFCCVTCHVKQYNK